MTSDTRWALTLLLALAQTGITLVVLALVPLVVRAAADGPGAVLTVVLVLVIVGLPLLLPGIVVAALTQAHLVGRLSTGVTCVVTAAASGAPLLAERSATTHEASTSGIAIAAGAGAIWAAGGAVVGPRLCARLLRHG